MLRIVSVSSLTASMGPGTNDLAIYFANEADRARAQKHVEECISQEFMLRLGELEKFTFSSSATLEELTTPERGIIMCARRASREISRASSKQLHVHAEPK